jgi:hypothetical protein
LLSWRISGPSSASRPPVCSVHSSSHALFLARWARLEFGNTKHQASAGPHSLCNSTPQNHSQLSIDLCEIPCLPKTHHLQLYLPQLLEHVLHVSQKFRVSAYLQGLARVFRNSNQSPFLGFAEVCPECVERSALPHVVGFLFVLATR